ncbi:MAG: M56 family metallopeptidase, partial [Salibacteraceae bacterium]
MNNFLVNTLEANLLVAALYACYRLSVHRLTTFAWNRLFLLLIPVVWLLLPLVELPPTPMASALPQLSLNEVVVGALPQASIPWMSWLLWSYWAVVGLLGLRLVWQITNLMRLFLRSAKVRHSSHWEVYLPDEQPSFSFLNVLFLNGSLSGNAKEIVVNHELVHIRQHHSFDLLFLQVVSVLFWFNPVWFFVKRSLVTVHEFLADADGSAGQPKQYSELLLSQSFQVPAMALSHAFYHQNLLKTRIKMLYKTPTNWRQRWRYALVLPVLCTWFVLACTPEMQDPLPGNAASEPLSSLKNRAEVDTPPSYPGGMSQLTLFLGENLQYPRKAKEANIEGKVM